MIELALGLARALGVCRASLFDATFYRRYGFVPVITSVWDAGNLRSDDPKRELCSALSQLKRVRASSLKTYLRAMLRHLDHPRPTLGHRFISHHYEFGVLQVQVLEVDEARDALPGRVRLMRPHDGPLLPLFGDVDATERQKKQQVLTCSAKSDLMELLAMGHPMLRPSVPSVSVGGVASLTTSMEFWNTDPVSTSFHVHPFLLALTCTLRLQRWSSQSRPSGSGQDPKLSA